MPGARGLLCQISRHRGCRSSEENALLQKRKGVSRGLDSYFGAVGNFRSSLTAGAEEDRLTQMTTALSNAWSAGTP